MKQGKLREFRVLKVVMSYNIQKLTLMKYLQFFKNDAILDWCLKESFTVWKLLLLLGGLQK